MHAIRPLSTRVMRWYKRCRSLAHFARLLSLGALAMGLSGCASTEIDESQWAELLAHDSNFPILYAQSIMILAVDGKRFGPKYKTVWVKPGYHEARIAFIDCALPVLVITCVASGGERTVPFEAEAGKRYYFRKAETIWVEEVKETSF